MAPPMTADEFLAALQDEGLTVVEVGDWRHHNRNHKGPWGPVHGAMIHHTVTKGSAYTVGLCRDGHADLPGPLCHGVITKDGRVHLVGYGRANHAGSGDGDVLAAVIAEKSPPPDNETDTDGNRYFYGFECENLGDGEDPWPAVQLEAIERVGAAICRAHGWGAGSVVGHLEWQPGKVDPRGFSMQEMRGRVAARLDGNQQEDDMALTADDIKKFWTADIIPNRNPATVEGNPTIAPSTALQNLEILARRQDARVAALTDANGKLVDAVAQLAAGIGDLDPAAIVAELRASIESITIHLDVPDA